MSASFKFQPYDFITISIKFVPGACIFRICVLLREGKTSDEPLMKIFILAICHILDMAVRDVYVDTKTVVECLHLLKS